jgi:uroporphyrinogen III methyltransferase/synthase
MSKVYLIGAGPGDPELITQKGARILAKADAILYDHLANDALLDLAPAEAERIYVGKKRAVHAHTQDEIISMMIERARRGRTVVRLKGGDPFIFGRGGEELEGLAQAQIPYEVIPGVTSPLGIGAYTGVPLTHREHTSVVTFVTGHDLNAVDWRTIATSETLVIFMGLHCIGGIAEAIIAAGRPESTPAMAVRWGTRPDQQTIVGTLATLPVQVKEAHLTPPTTVIIGDVVTLRDKLNWFEKLPLFGQRIVVTRPKAQAGELNTRLHELGAEVINLPAIEIRALDDYSKLDACIQQIAGYDWLIFTSANAVGHFVARLHHEGLDWRAVRARICAIGPATQEALSGLIVDLVPSESHAEGVAAAFGELDMRGKRVLLPRAAAAREVVPEALTKMGARVDIADAYQNVVPSGLDVQARQVFERHPDWIIFTSSSTVKNVLSATPITNVKVATIGPATSDTARKHGLTVDAEARAPTPDALIAAILAVHREPRRSRSGHQM